MRLTVIAESETSITLGAEGDLVAGRLGPRLFEQECLRYLRHGQKLILDVSQVARLDWHGIETLERLQAVGVKLVGRPQQADELSRRKES